MSYHKAVINTDGSIHQFELTPAIPQLPSGNIEKTAEFFEEYLGFEVLLKMTERGFLSVKRGAAEIHFWKAESEEEAKKFARVSSCYIRVINISGFFDEVKSKGTKFRYELTEMPWGMNKFQVDDIFGNAIRFGEAVS
jgi:uncharacterized glyoxalase superfamily protein PhnB